MVTSLHSLVAVYILFFRLAAAGTFHSTADLEDAKKYLSDYVGRDSEVLACGK
jgi:cobalamin biosynthesis protein CobD/CbiB